MRIFIRSSGDFNPDLIDLANATDTFEQRVRYRGNPMHKRYPENYQLTPPAAPRFGKTLCDERRRISKEEAEMLLLAGIRKSLYSSRMKNGYPRHIWAVGEDGFVFEASLDDSERGTYHGYPLASAQRCAIERLQKVWGER